MKLLLMWLLGVPVLVAIMVMASRTPAYASRPSDHQAQLSLERCTEPAQNAGRSRQICRNML
jgi:hypothetical protein